MSVNEYVDQLRQATTRDEVLVIAFRATVDPEITVWKMQSILRPAVVRKKEVSG